MSQKCQKQAEAQRYGVINQRNYNLNQFDTANVDALKTIRMNRSRWEDLVACAIDGIHWSTSSDTHQVVEMKPF